MEAVLKRDRLILGMALLAVVCMAWGWLLVGAGLEMGPNEMTAMAGMDGGLMQPAIWT